MWYVVIVSLLVTIDVCFAAHSKAQKPTKIYTANDVDELKDMFVAHRNNEALEHFAAAVGDTSLLDKGRPNVATDLVHMYLSGKPYSFFDSLRKAYLYCSQKDDERLMGLFKQFVHSTRLQNWPMLFHCLPYTPDFRKEEHGLLAIMSNMSASKPYTPEFRKDEHGFLAMFASKHLLTIMRHMRASGDLSTGLLWQSAPIFESWKLNWKKRGARDGKKYSLAMLKYELVNAPQNVREELIKKAKHCLGLQDLVDLERFIVGRIGREYSLGDVEKVVLGPNRISATEESECILFGISNGFTDPPTDPFSKLPFDIWRQVLLNMDWRTLMYSMPYINKAMHKYITESRILSECPDLKNYMREQSEISSADFMYAFEHPWNTIFPTFPKFLAHHFLHHKSRLWYYSLFDFLQSYKDYDLLLGQCKPDEGHHPSGIPMKHLAIIFSSIVDSQKDSLISVFDQFPRELAVLLMGRVDNCKLITDFFVGDDSDKVQKLFYECVLRADVLHWPEPLTIAVENRINAILHTQITLPFTAEKIQQYEAEQLKSMITTFRDPLLIIKIFNALLQVDSEAKSILTLKEFGFIFDSGLLNYPKAMTAEQFQMFVELALKMHGSNDSFQKTLSRFIANITL